jgi:hypothetical protein
LDVGEIPSLVEKDGVSQWVVLLRLVKNNWSWPHQATTPLGSHGLDQAVSDGLGWMKKALIINGCWQVIPACHWFIMVYPSFHKTVLKQVVHSISINLMFLSAILVLQHVMLKEQMAHVQRKNPFFRGCFLGGESDGYTPHLKPIGALFLFLHVKCNR